MFAYQLRLAWKSLRRNPVLSLLIIGGIGLGIAVSMTFITGHNALASDPIPHKSDRLFYVQMDAWDPERPWDDVDPSEPPNQLTYRDAMAAMSSDIPTYQSAMYKTELTVHSPNASQRPTREMVRMCFGDFFPMFDVPFQYGTGWDRRADEAPEPVVVLGSAMNQKLFGGENSVGRTLRIENREFRVVGVLAFWKPLIKFYDTNNREMEGPEGLFMPFGFGREMELYSSGNSSGWKTFPRNAYQDFLDSEVIWLQMWVQLDGKRQWDEYMAFLDAYALEQKQLGRFGRPINNRLRDVVEWLRKEEVVPQEATALLIISILFLLICSVNLIGILLGKFLARSPEVGIRRALGASRRWVFVQHLIECELVGVIGGVIGLALSVVGLRVVGRLFEDPLLISLDLHMVGVGIALALLAGLVAGIYPAWRICRVDPAVHLKTQ